MKPQRTLVLSLLGVAFAMGCSPSGDDQTRVTEPNELGVTAITIDRFTENGDKVFELRGLDASGAELALVRVHTGHFAEILTIPDAEGDFGNEITTDVGGEQTRSLTQSLELIDLVPRTGSALQTFVALDPVSATLEQEASLIVHLPSARSAPEAAYSTATCPSNYLNPSPLAQQCCYYTINTFKQVIFYNGSQIVAKTQNPYGAGCRNSDGLTHCSAGKSCTYGPAGFKQPSVNAPPPIYWAIEPEAEPTDCIAAGGFGTPQGPFFSNVTGTFVDTTQGCTL